MLPIETLVLVGGILLFVGVVASKLSDWVGIPTLLVFLVIGMLAGEEGVGRISFDSPSVAQATGTVALLIILFAGGLDTQWSSVRSVLAPGLMLSTLGVLITTLSMGAFAWFMLGTYSTFDIGEDGLSWSEALLLAAIVSSTDAAAVFSVFRTSKVKPTARIRHLLEFESGSNDPVAVLMTMAILGVMASNSASIAGVGANLITELLAGAISGFALGWSGCWVVNRLHLSASGLHPILVLSIGLTTFGFATLIGGNGYLAIYVCGVTLGNRIVRHHDGVLRFHDALSWLAQLGNVYRFGTASRSIQAALRCGSRDCDGIVFDVGRSSTECHGMPVAIPDATQGGGLRIVGGTARICAHRTSDVSHVLWYSRR